MIVTFVWAPSFGQTPLSANLQVGHDSWTFQDGAPEEIYALARTDDGSSGLELRPDWCILMVCDSNPSDLRLAINSFLRLSTPCSRRPPVDFGSATDSEGLALWTTDVSRTTRPSLALQRGLSGVLLNTGME